MVLLTSAYAQGQQGTPLASSFTTVIANQPETVAVPQNVSPGPRLAPATLGPTTPQPGLETEPLQPGVMPTPEDAGSDSVQGRQFGLEQESQPYQQLLDLAIPRVAPTWGPTPVDQVGLLSRALRINQLFGDSIRTFGWMEMGYSGSSSGSGALSVQPRLNRFGNEFLFNQLGFVIQKPLQQDRLDWGFNIRYFAGADAATGQPKGGIDDPPGNPRFGQDFRDLYLSAHLPILTEGGMNVKVGRMNTIIGWNGFLAPWRPFYSSDYQFFYSQDGAFTGALTQLIVSDQLDVWNGVTLGANTFFDMRSPGSVCYIGQVNYWLTKEKKTRATASVYAGKNAIFAAPGLGGDFDTIVELRLQHWWTQRFFQVVQSNMGWASDTPVGTGSWYGLYTAFIYNLTHKWDLMARAEWFNDTKGTRTGFGTNYSEVTLGVNWHPNSYLEIRPEIRGDFAGERAFGGGSRGPREYSQLTGGISALFKF